MPRQIGQRLTFILIPPLVGGIADHWGANESLVILRAQMLMLCVPLALITGRAALSDWRAKARPSFGAKTGNRSAPLWLCFSLWRRVWGAGPS